jgi:hypothetical protein
MNLSSIFTINWADLGKAIVVLFITTFLGIIALSLEAGKFPTSVELLKALHTAALATLSYLVKNILTNNQGQFLKPDVKAGSLPYTPRSGL